MATLADSIKAAAQTLIFTAGMAHAVTTADIQGAANTLSKQYAQTSARQIETEIREHIDKKR